MPISKKRWQESEMAYSLSTSIINSGKKKLSLIPFPFKTTGLNLQLIWGKNN